MSRLKAILFDLDGTLLPMDTGAFTKYYFGELCKKLAPYGYDPKELIAAVWKGVEAMVNGEPDGTTCEERFWASYAEDYGADRLAERPVIDEFYANEFNRAKVMTQPTPLSLELVNTARSRAELVLLSTNPIFPRTATLNRISWAGLTPEMFDRVTAYEDCRHAKPDPRYFLDLMKEFDLQPEECLVIGNDVNEDINCAAAAGIPAYLITDCILGDPGTVDCPKGSMRDCIDFLASLPAKE